MIRNHLQEIIIKPAKAYGTFFTVEDKTEEEFPYDNLITEWELPHEQIQEYDVWFRQINIGKFWVSNIAPSSVSFALPLDLEVAEYIFTQIRVREFKEDYSL